jgi:hypothetical protein
MAESEKTIPITANSSETFNRVFSFYQKLPDPIHNYDLKAVIKSGGIGDDLMTQFIIDGENNNAVELPKNHVIVDFNNNELSVIFYCRVDGENVKYVIQKPTKVFRLYISSH